MDAESVDVFELLEKRHADAGEEGDGGGGGLLRLAIGQGHEEGVENGADIRDFLFQVLLVEELLGDIPHAGKAVDGVTVYPGQVILGIKKPIGVRAFDDDVRLQRFFGALPRRVCGKLPFWWIDFVLLSLIFSEHLAANFLPHGVECRAAEHHFFRVSGVSLCLFFKVFKHELQDVATTGVELTPHLGEDAVLEVIVIPQVILRYCVFRYLGQGKQLDKPKLFQFFIAFVDDAEV